MPLPKLSVLFGSLLLILGIAAYLLTGRQSPTALIPSVFGLLIGGAGALALARPGARRHAGHAVAVLALLGIGGTFRALFKLPALFAGQAERPAAVVTQVLMCVVCTVLLALCIKSFVAARRNPPAA